MSNFILSQRGLGVSVITKMMFGEFLSVVMCGNFGMNLSTPFEFHEHNQLTNTKRRFSESPEAIEINVNTTGTSNFTNS